MFSIFGFYGGPPGGMGGYYGGGDPWSGRAEKSASATRRENSAKQTFDTLRTKVERAPIVYRERLVNLGCRCLPDESDGSSSSGQQQPGGSLFRMLPEVAVDEILEYARPEGFRVDAADASNDAGSDAAGQPSAGGGVSNGTAAVAGAASAPPNKTLTRKKGGRPPAASKRAAAAANTTAVSPHLTVNEIEDLFEPGRKHTLHLLNPTDHLTGACWRDFSRYVRTFDGWNARRVEATPAEKKKFRENRKGKVYFVKVVYTVPGTPRKKKGKVSRKRKAAAAPAPADAAAATKITASDDAAGSAPAAVASTGASPFGPVVAAGGANALPAAATGLPKKVPAVPAPRGGTVPYAPTACPPSAPDSAQKRNVEAARRAAGYVLPAEFAAMAATSNAGDSKPPAKKNAK